MATTTSFYTIASPSEGVYTDKGSKFIGFAFPINSQEEFKTFLKTLKAEHSGARHFCYAYRIRGLNMLERNNDDGEPSGTAGKPIFNQLLSNHLTNIAVVVVRYFGGTLLGTTGLIKAYKYAAKLAIENASVIEKDITIKKMVTIPYSIYNGFMNLAKKHHLQPISTQTNDIESQFSVDIPIKIEELWLKELTQLLNEK